MHLVKYTSIIFLNIAVGYARTNVIGSGTSFVIASLRSSIHLSTYLFRGNPFQTHSLEQSYDSTQPFKQEKYNYISKNVSVK